MYKSLIQGFQQRVSVSEARKTWGSFRADHGWAGQPTPLLTSPSGNAKLEKGGQWGLSLAPHRISGYNTCPYSTPGCRAVCLHESGRAIYFPKILRGRVTKTKFLFEHTVEFATLLDHEVRKIPKGSGLRLNVFSDLPWERIYPEVFTYGLHVYDYTKWPPGKRDIPAGYDITYSASERWTDQDIVDAIAEERAVSVVVRLARGKPVPDKYLGIPVIDGDKQDARYADVPGSLVMLRAKGKAVNDETGFVKELP